MVSNMDDTPPELTADMYIAHIEGRSAAILKKLDEYRSTNHTTKRFTDLEMQVIEEHTYDLVAQNNDLIKRIRELKDE